MTRKNRLATGCMVLAALSGGAQAAEQAADAKPFNVETLTEMQSISDVALSPDGQQLVYRLSDPGRAEGHEKSSELWLMPVDKPEAARPLTHSPGAETHATWAPDGQALYFVAKRDLTHQQVWKLPLNGGEARPLTDLPIDVESFKLSPNGQRLMLQVSVYTGCKTLQCTADKLAAAKDKKANGRVYDQLMVRHWDTWSDHRFHHLLSATITDDGYGVTDVKDLMADWATNVPPKPFSGLEEATFTPDSESIIFSAKAPAEDHAWTTNFDLWKVPVSGDKEPTNLTEANTAWDGQPTFSPDGRYLAYLAMKEPGFEADRFRIVLVDQVSGETKTLTEKWDRSPRSLVFGPDSRTLYVTAPNLGQVGLFAIDTQFGEVKELLSDGTVGNVLPAKDHVYFTRHALNQPTALYSMYKNGEQRQKLVDPNAELMRHVKLGEFKQFSFPGWHDEKVYGYWIKPVGFDKSKKYPVAFLIHGGPQGSFGNMFHHRWNAQLWAAAGYAVVMIDFHGSVGYGQAFTDSISGDWGGKPLVDLQKGLAYIRKEQPWIGDKGCALGGSYGGYMVDWIAGNWPDGFDCLVSHAGVFDTRSMYYTTEELWFPEHENGAPQFADPESYEKFNPLNHVAKWKTPMLVIDGQQDFRVPYGQGLGAFTALQRQGIPSKLIIYPNENHWVLNPDNLVQWYDQVLGWMDKWTKTTQK